MDVPNVTFRVRMAEHPAPAVDHVGLRDGLDTGRDSIGNDSFRVLYRIGLVLAQGRGAR